MGEPHQAAGVRQRKTVLACTLVIAVRMRALDLSAESLSLSAGTSCTTMGRRGRRDALRVMWWHRLPKILHGWAVNLKQGDDALSTLDRDAAQACHHRPLLWVLPVAHDIFMCMCLASLTCTGWSLECASMPSQTQRGTRLP